MVSHRPKDRNRARGINTGLQASTAKRTSGSLDKLEAQKQRILTELETLIAAKKFEDAATLVDISPHQLSRDAGLGENFLNGKKHNYGSSRDKKDSTKGKVELFISQIKDQLARAVDRADTPAQDRNTIQAQLARYKRMFKNASDALRASNACRDELNARIEDMQQEIRELKSKIKPNVIALPNR